MKLQQIIVIGCLSVIVTGCSTAHSYCRSSSTMGCETECEVISDCECTDPACSYNGFGGNCMDGIKCCEVFGNIGGKRYDSSDSAEAYRYESYDSAEAYFSNYVNGDISPVPSTSYEAPAPTRTVTRSYKMENFKGQ
jgi:hypothetical protein